jgi:hypothetical protein
MASEYQCPRCKSDRVLVNYSIIECHSCGWSESLIDYPISWSMHRSLCRIYGTVDPGPVDSSPLESIEVEKQPVERHPQKVRYEVPPPVQPRLHGGVSL